MEDLQIVIMDYDQYSRDDFTGQVTIPLNRLRDQLKHTETFDLYDKNGSLGKGKIKLGLQWIHSRVNYFFFFLSVYLMMSENLILKNYSMRIE